jgi:tRNA dimethylallyltransferase
MIRAIEIARYKQHHDPKPSPLKSYRLYGIRIERETLRQRIKDRLDHRLASGMIEEVEGLLQSGISKEILFYYGLEYRYLAQYLNGEIDYQLMYEKLLQGIRRFAKKQMTWFRRMEKQGETIHWLDGNMGAEKLSNLIKMDYEH